MSDERIRLNYCSFEKFFSFPVGTEKKINPNEPLIFNILLKKSEKEYLDSFVVPKGWKHANLEVRPEVFNFS
jgi:hypothetical protein